MSSGVVHAGDARARAAPTAAQASSDPARGRGGVERFELEQRPTPPSGRRRRRRGGRGPRRAGRSRRRSRPGRRARERAVGGVVRHEGAHGRGVRPTGCARAAGSRGRAGAAASRRRGRRASRAAQARTTSARPEPPSGPASSARRATTAVPASTRLTVVAPARRGTRARRPSACPPSSAGSRPAECACPPLGRRASASSSADRQGVGWRVTARRQNIEYSWASGRRTAGAGSTTSPSIVISNVSGPDVDPGQHVVVAHVGLADAAGGPHGGQLAPQPEPVGQAVLERGRGDEGRATGRRRSRRRTPGACSTGCGRGDGRVRVAEGAPTTMRAALDHDARGGRRRTAGPTARGRRACRPRPSRRRGRCRGRSRG